MKLSDAETSVEVENSLGTAINKIREVLGDSAENQCFVETLLGCGYCLSWQGNGLQRDARCPATTGESDQLEASKRSSSAWQPLWLRVGVGIAVAFAIAVFAWGIG